MKPYWILRGIKIAALVALVIAGLSWVVMSLWNWLLPGLFGWPTLGFAQAAGLLLLSRLLFGGLRGHGGCPGGRFGDRMRKWHGMSEAEREQLRTKLRGRCGPWGLCKDGTQRDDTDRNTP